MKRTLLTLAAACLLLGSIGCHHNVCQSCGPGGVLGQHGRNSSDYVGRLPANHHARGGVEAPTGPPTAAVAYPYYTTRAPRDFLNSNPPSIGP